MPLNEEGVSLRADIKGEAFYFYVQAKPYTALRLVLDMLELTKLPCPTAMRILKNGAGDNSHQVTLLPKEWPRKTSSSNLADYQALAGEAFWRLSGRGLEYEAVKILKEATYVAESVFSVSELQRADCPGSP